MPDGRRVQDLDLRSISSRRRNPIIANIFNRLKYMDRRGSGFKKILICILLDIKERRARQLLQMLQEQEKVTYTSVLNANAYGARGTYRMGGIHTYLF